MKTFTKTVIIVASLLLIFGVIVSIAGLAMGGRFAFQFGRENVSYSADPQGADDDEIRSLKFQFDYGDVRIVRGDDFQVEGMGVRTGQLQQRTENGVWIIEYKVTSLSFWQINVGSNDTVTITVTLPYDFVPDRVELDVGAGVLSCDELACDTAIFNVGAGYMKLQGFEGRTADISCGLGNVEMEGVIRESGVLECGVGRIALTLHGDEKDYNYDIDVGLGHAKVNQNESGGNISQRVTNNDSDRNFRLQCGLGDIELMIQ